MNQRATKDTLQRSAIHTQSRHNMASIRPCRYALVSSLNCFVLQVLSLIVCSANGMSVSEVLHLAPSPLTAWTPLYYALIDRHILVETAGLLRPTNEKVE